MSRDCDYAGKACSGDKRLRIYRDQLQADQLVNLATDTVHLANRKQGHL
jgi:hypothetical protein